MDPHEHDWFRALIEDILTVLPFPSIRRLLAHPVQRSGGYIHFYAKLRIGWLAKYIIAFCTVGLFAAPVVALSHCGDRTGVKTAIVVSFMVFHWGCVGHFHQAEEQRMLRSHR